MKLTCIWTWSQQSAQDAEKGGVGKQGQQQGLHYVPCMCVCGCLLASHSCSPTKWHSLTRSLLTQIVQPNWLLYSFCWQLNHSTGYPTYLCHTHTHPHTQTNMPDKVDTSSLPLPCQGSKFHYKLFIWLLRVSNVKRFYERIIFEYPFESR